MVSNSYYSLLHGTNDELEYDQDHRVATHDARPSNEQEEQLLVPDAHTIVYPGTYNSSNSNKSKHTYKSRQTERWK